VNTTKVVIGQSQEASTGSYAELSGEGDFDITHARSGEDVVRSLYLKHRPELLVVDSSLENPSGPEICLKVKSDPELKSIPIIFIYNEAPASFPMHVYDIGFDEIFFQPLDVRILGSRCESLIILKNLMKNARDSDDVLVSLTDVLESKDPMTRGHADRVAQYSVELGKELGLGGLELKILHKGGILHDVGKVAIPDPILNKPGKYTPEEFDIMKRHPSLGCEMCRHLSSVQDALPLIECHHEKLDGSGYPNKLNGDQIGPLVRIITITDIYDALRSRRSYKDVFSIDQSFATLWDEANQGWWDKDLLGRWEKIVRTRHD
jgi:putative two-component system response regulator